MLSGRRVSNAWTMCPLAGDTVSKGTLIPHNVPERHLLGTKLPGREEQSAYYQVVGEVTAHQAYDG
jgi:hypothetical protein